MREIEYKQIEIVTVMGLCGDPSYALGYAKTMDDETVELKFKSVIHTHVKNPRDAVPRWVEPNKWESHMRVKHKDLT